MEKIFENDRIVHDVNVSLLARMLNDDYEGSWHELSDERQWHIVRTAMLIGHRRLLSTDDMNEVIDAVIGEIPRPS